MNVEMETKIPAGAQTLKPAVSLRRMTRALAGDTRGANLVEYILLVGLVAVLTMAGFRTFGNKVKTKIEKQSNTVESIRDSEN